MKRKPRRIGLVTLEYPPHPGGAARAAQRLVGFLTGSGYDVTVFVPDENAGKAAPARPEEVWIDSLDLSAPRNDPETPRGTARSGRANVIVVPIKTALFDDLAAAILSEDAKRPFALFHGFFLHAAMPCFHPELYAHRARPVIASIRGIDALWMNTLHRDRCRIVLKHASFITSVSTESLLRADRIADISERSAFIPNSIDTDLYEPWRRTAANRGVVGTVCTFREKKGLPELLQAYGLLRSGIRRRLLLVGDFQSNSRGDELRAIAREVIERYKMQDEVEITGLIPQEEVGRHLARMRVFVVASLHEGLPNAMLEAAAAGVPIVATAVDGNRDVLRHRRNALLVPPADVRSLSGAIDSVLRSGELADRLSKGARRLATRLSPDHEKRAWLALYEKLLG